MVKKSHCALTQTNRTRRCNAPDAQLASGHAHARAAEQGTWRADTSHRTLLYCTSDRVQKGTREVFQRLDASDHKGPDAPQRPINLSCFAASLAVYVTRTGRWRNASGHYAPDEQVRAPLSSPAVLNWPDTPTASGRLDHCVQSKGKYAFHFPKIAKSRRACKRVPNPSLPLKLHRLRKCANTTKCTSPPCARVSAFSQLFSRR
jgi:hypothetical protein